jgi:erythromycin esterase-like protein
MSEAGMYNIGELARVQHSDKGVVLVGFGSYQGSVMAGRKWGSEIEKMKVPTALAGSWEHALHEVGIEQNLLLMKDFMDDTFLENHLGHRVIGVVYNPSLEKYGNYVPSILPLRYDAFMYVDKTKALRPLHIQPDGHQIPETYPFGI